MRVSKCDQAHRRLKKQTGHKDVMKKPKSKEKRIAGTGNHGRISSLQQARA
jgi:hypothetical protein